MAETSASSEFSERLAELINGTGVRPPRIERLLRGRAAAVRRTTIYNWLDGSNLPLSLESLLAVVHACADHAEIKVSRAALRSDREWTALLADAKQERDSQAGRAAQAHQRGPGERSRNERGLAASRSDAPGPPPNWKALHPAEAADRLTQMDRRDPDRAVAEIYAMDAFLANAVLERIDHARALSLLARVQPDWVAGHAAEAGWFRNQILLMPSDRGAEVFDALSRKSPQAAAWTLSAMGPDDALRFLNAVEYRHKPKVLQSMRREDVDRLLDQMTPGCATAALAAHTQWGAYMLMVEMDRPRAETIITRIGPDGLAAVLDCATAKYVAELVAHMDPDEAAGWLERMEAFYVTAVLGFIAPRRIAGLMRDPGRGPGWWLARMKPADAAKVLEAIAPDEAAAAIGRLEPDLAAGCLNEMSPDAAGRALTAGPDSLGLPRTAELVCGMDLPHAGAALVTMEPDTCVLVLKRAGPDLLDAVLAAHVRSDSGSKIAQIIQAVCERPGDLAGLLTRNPQIAEALPAPRAAAALALLDEDHAHQVLRRLPRAEMRYPDQSSIGGYAGQQIIVLKAIRQLDEAMADRLEILLGLQERGWGDSF